MFLVPSDHPNITDAEHIPNSRIRVDWSSVFFSNGEITRYFLLLIKFNQTVVRNLPLWNTASYSPSRYEGYDVVDIAVQAVNQNGIGPISPYRRVSTIGMFMYLLLCNACRTLGGDNLSDRLNCQ